MNPTISRSRRLRIPAPLASAAFCLLLGSGAAHAVIGTPSEVDEVGGYYNLSYGQDGNVFELQPNLYVQGVGNATFPNTIATLSTWLTYSFSAIGYGTGLAELSYTITNTSPSFTFNDLRFMVYANPDGDQVDYLDTIEETWGPAVDGEAVRREGRAFTNPLFTLFARIPTNNGLTEGATPVDVECTQAAGCDATLGLQWNLAALAPGEAMTVTLGLSDDGRSLSGRSLRAVAVNTPDTTLTLSGLVTVSAVPEVSTGLMWLAGLGAVGALAGRRRPG